MLKKIVDFKKVSPELKERLKNEFPDGFEEGDIIKFKNMHGEEVKAIRMEDPENEIVYLIKIERKLTIINDEFLEDDDEITPDPDEIDGDWGDEDEEEDDDKDDKD